MKGTHMGARVGVWLMQRLAVLPLPLLRALGWLLGQVLYVLAVPRRRIALRNFQLCFPEASAAQHRAWVRETFVYFCQAFLDRSWLWSAPEEVVRARVKLEGAVHELDGTAPTILFAPHFYGMDAGGLALPLHTQRPFTSIFSTHPNPVLDAWFMAGRQRFGEVKMLNRDDGVKPIIANLRQGGLLYLLPDMDFGPKESIFVPYFGQQAATIPSLSRFARLGRAKVLGMYTRMTPTGYVAEITPAWQNFPTEDVAADTTRMNRELEAVIRTMPSQYYWVHKRFKSRSEGEPSVYA